MSNTRTSLRSDYCPICAGISVRQLSESVSDFIGIRTKMILFGERALRHCLEQFVGHFHAERNHQGKGNVILFPAPADRIGELSGEVCTRERLGGLLRFYHREAA